MDMLILSSVEETKRIEKMGDLLGTEPAGERERLWSLSMSRPKPIYKMSMEGNQMGSGIVWMIPAASHDSRQFPTLQFKI